MKKNTAVKIIILVVVIVMLIPIFADMSSNSALKKIKYSDFEKTVSDTANYGFSLVYIGEDEKDTKNEIKEVISNYNSKDANVTSYFMDKEDLSSSDMQTLLNNSNASVGYVFIANGEVIYTESKKLDSKKLDALVSEYTANGISEDLVNYKVFKDADAYEKAVKDKKTITMAVFGRDTCFYCNQFKPVYNTVSAEYGLDIYYFDSDSYDKDEYQSIMDMGLTIPASCTQDNKEAKLADGFGTPLTLFTKNGKVIDCISGYLNKEGLISKLETVGMIKSEEE